MYLENLPYKIPDPSINNQFNYAQANEFYVVALKIPGVSFYLQKFNLPGITMDGVTKQPTPFTDIQLTGTKLIYEPLVLDFIVNESLENYFSVMNWMVGIGFPNNNQQFIDAVKSGKINSFKHMENALTSQIDILPLDSKHNPLAVVSFQNAFPVSLSSLEWATVDSDVNYLKATVTMAYTLYQIIQ